MDTVHDLEILQSPLTKRSDPSLTQDLRSGTQYLIILKIATHRKSSKLNIKITSHHLIIVIAAPYLPNSGFILID